MAVKAATGRKAIAVHKPMNTTTASGIRMDREEEGAIGPQGKRRRKKGVLTAKAAKEASRPYMYVYCLRTVRATLLPAIILGIHRSSKEARRQPSAKLGMKEGEARTRRGTSHG